MSRNHPVAKADPQRVAPADDGVDITLIRWMLSLTPQQRLRVLQNNIGSIQRLRRAHRRP